LTHDQPRATFASSVRQRPPQLSNGARVALVAPAGPLRDERDLQRGIENVRSLGWEPVVSSNALARDGYFAGGDDHRAAALNRALRDESIEAIWCLRGGYGTMRILDALDFDAFCRHPKAVIGYSDITALHAALAVRCGVMSYHGPTARAQLTPFSRASLQRAVAEQCDSLGAANGARTIRGGRAEGVLAGGNVALLAALAGTPYAPRFDGAIVVLEDIDEAVYRIDRMLRQLLMARMLDGAAALAFGACTNCPEAADDGSRRLDDVVAETADLLGIPAVRDIPVGHIADQWTVPLGARAALDADARALTLVPSVQP
jgi:muramoyltetrapeptide carboxypeptidase